MHNAPNSFRRFLLVLMSLGGLLTLIGLVSVSAQSTAPNPDVIETDSHIFTRMADGVYQITGTGKVFVMSNAMLIVGENDLLIVDSHVTPHAASVLLEAVRAVSDKPLRYLINTHYHFDHAHGNQVFPAEVEIIGHHYTRAKLSGALGNVLEEPTFLSFTEGVPDLVARLEQQLAETTDPARKAALEVQLNAQRAHMESLPQTIPTPPNITFENELMLYQTVMHGSREIQLLHLGRAHTGGDVVVYLPAERLVYSGDMMLPFLAYMGDGYAQDWPQTLEALKQLEFDTILPGHGAPIQGKTMIDHFQRYLEDIWAKTAAMKAQGLTAEQTAQQIDLSNHRANYPQIQGPGADVRAIRRIYALLDE